jgi:hypothetical protein
MPCPSHPPWLDHSNYTWRGVQVMKLLIMQFSPTSCDFINLIVQMYSVFENIPTETGVLHHIWAAEDNNLWFYNNIMRRRGSVLTRAFCKYSLQRALKKQTSHETEGLHITWLNGDISPVHSHAISGKEVTRTENVHAAYRYNVKVGGHGHLDLADTIDHSGQ